MYDATAFVRSRLQRCQGASNKPRLLQRLKARGRAVEVSPQGDREGISTLKAATGQKKAAQSAAGYWTIVYSELV
jgi:hypothetical protein